MDVVEWSRALDVRLSEWCCSVTMVWVQIPSREEQKFDSSKIYSNTVWFNFQTFIYIYIYIYKMKKNKYHTVGTIAKSNIKIVERQNL